MVYKQEMKISEEKETMTNEGEQSRNKFKGKHKGKFTTGRLTKRKN
jgi:hypothetical protein